VHSVNQYGKQVRKRLFNAVNKSVALTRSKPPLTPSYGATINTYMIPLDPSEFKSLLLDYVVAENQACTTIESTRLQAILKYYNLAVNQQGCFPVYKTIYNWIEVAFEANVGLIQEFLRLA
jgi:hypothetical protein